MAETDLTLQQTEFPSDDQLALGDASVEHSLEFILPTSEPQQTPGQELHRRRYSLSKLTAGVALAGAALFAGTHSAHTAPPETAGQIQVEEAGFDFNSATASMLGLSGAVTGYAAYRRSGKDKREDNHFGVLDKIADAKSGEALAMHVRSLVALANRDRHNAADYFDDTVAYFRGRRDGLKQLEQKFKGDETGLQRAVDGRRNADRSMLKLLNGTVDAAREALQKGVKESRAEKGPANATSAFVTLAEQVGINIDTSPRVNARGLCLNKMRDVSNCDFRNIDLTGAWMEENQFTLMLFDGAIMNEIQVKGSSVRYSSLNDADLRGAYWHEAEVTSCTVNENTKFGNLPEDHPDATHGANRPHDRDGLRGNPRVILKDLIPATPDINIKELVYEWQRNGLVLIDGSDKNYLLPDDDPYYKDHPKPDRRPTVPATHTPRATSH